MLHLQVAQGQPTAETRRHDCDGNADLHAVPRDAAPRGLSAAHRGHRGPPGGALAIHRSRSRASSRRRRQGVLRSQPREPVRRGAQPRVDRCDRQAAGAAP